MMDIKQVLEIKLVGTDIGDVTVAGYLKQLLLQLWGDGEGFSGKRPFGNSGWEYEIYTGLVRKGIISGSVDEYGNIEDFDSDAARKVVIECINSLGYQEQQKKSEVNEYGFKVGDRFEALKDKKYSMFLEGSIVELHEDDGSNCPYFKIISGNQSENKPFAWPDAAYENYNNLRKIED